MGLWAGADLSCQILGLRGLMGGGEWTDKQNSLYILQDLIPLGAPSQKVVECGSSEAWDSCFKASAHLMSFRADLGLFDSMPSL